MMTGQGKEQKRNVNCLTERILNLETKEKPSKVKPEKKPQTKKGQPVKRKYKEEEEEEEEDEEQQEEEYTSNRDEEENEGVSGFESVSLRRSLRLNKKVISYCYPLHKPSRNAYTFI